MDRHGSSEFKVVEFVRSGGSPTLPVEIAAELDGQPTNLTEDLRSCEPRGRLLGVVRLAAFLSAGRNPPIALQLAMSLWDAVSANLLAELGIPGSTSESVCHNLAITIGTAAIANGDADTAVRIADLVLGRFEKPEPSIEENAVRGLIQKFRFDEAWERYQRLPFSPDLEGALRDWRPVAQPEDVLRPQPIDTRTQQQKLDAAARAAASRWVLEQREQQAQFKTAFMAEQHSTEGIVAFERAWIEMEAALDTVRDQVAAGLVDNANEIFNREIFRYQTAVRHANALKPTDVGNHLQAQHAGNYAATVLSDPARTNEMLMAALTDLRSALAWFKDRQALAAIVSTNWATGLILEELGDESEALACFREVFEAVIAVAAARTDPAGKAATLRTYPNLYRRLVRLGLRHGEVALALNASEALRGIVYLSSKNPVIRVEDAPAVEWHYLSIFVDDDGCVVFLRLGDGTLYTHQPDIGRLELDALTSRVSPRDWGRSQFRETGSPRNRLSSLMTPLQQGVKEGRLKRGDHLVVAMDYPLNLVPMHYLDALDRAAVHDFSFSRAASLSDAMTIERSETRPAAASARLVAIPASDNTDQASHIRNARNAVRPLQTLALGFHMTKEETDASSLGNILRAADIVHIQSHGFFPVASPAETVDPLKQAGLLVSSAGSWPDRSRPEKYLMSGRDIISGGACHARHVSLAACVSGLGRPGSAGDMLGVEFALRHIGVASVTASHWHVDLDTASSFHSEFYRCWIVEGQTRGQAWRSATLSLIDRYGPTEQDWARACAFSLYGSWQ